MELDLLNPLPTSRVELMLSANNLLGRRAFSKSDPVCVLYQKDVTTNEYTELGRSEQVKSNPNPSWRTKFTVDYHFEERRVLKFEVYNWDGISYSLTENDLLGCVECSLGEIIASPNKMLRRTLTLGDNKGPSSLVVSAHELGTNNEIIHLKINGRNFEKMDFFGKTDPFIVIAKKMDNGSWINVHTTETIKNTLNPDWKPFTMRVPSLTSWNPDRPLRFQVFDWDNDGSSDFIGEFETTLTELLTLFRQGRATFEIVNQTKKKTMKSYFNSGFLKFEWIAVEEEKSFIEYIQMGVQLHVTVAIDFTASNNEDEDSRSTFYTTTDNEYSLAIKAIGEVIQDYDADMLFPALGFGAIVPPSSKVSHVFFLNGQIQDPFCTGVEGILEAYHQCLSKVEFSGPAHLAPVINRVSRVAASYQNGLNYFTLLIVTKGNIDDMDATKDAIINASVFPLSIIIIGVGNADFSTMKFLDSDGHLLSHNDREAVRDIVQFVELRKFITDDGSMNEMQTQMLAKEVLAEIPNQLTEYMRTRSVQ